jgi:phage I-like protein
VALAAALDLTGGGGGDLPDWVQLLPAGGRIETFDHRGPYFVRDPEALLRASLQDPRGIFIDENHATDRGEAAAPAMGWVEALEIRDGAVWGRVAWTPQGEALVRSRAYRGISPVLFLDPADPRAVVRIGRASLVNIPNLRGLAALNAEGSVTFIERVAARLGLPADAGEEALIAAIPEAGAPGAAAAQSALAEIGAVFGAEGAPPAALVATARAAQAAVGQIAALQSEIAALRAGRRREEAETFVDAEIAAGRAIPAPDRETWIALHMEQPETARRLIGSLPRLGPSGAAARPPGAAAPRPALNAAARPILRALGVTETQAAAILNAEASSQEAR